MKKQMGTEFKKETPKMTVIINGSLDTITAPELEEKLIACWEDITELVLDFISVDYISSAVMRVVVACDQRMSEVEGSYIYTI